MNRLIFFISFFLLLVGLSYAEEKALSFSLEPGYKLYSVDKSPALVNEYYKSKSSPAIKFNAKDYGEDYRYNVKLNINEYDDYDFDIHAYYKDKVRLELSGVYFDHLLGLKTNTTMIDLTPSAEYLLKYRNQNVSLKYKPFNYPFHIVLMAEKIEREGNFQKRFYGPATSNPQYNSVEDIFSRKAPINFVSNVAGISIDGLLGGVNLFFDANVSTAKDDAKATDDGILKIPEIREEYFNFKATTNQSGKISAAISLTKKEKNNENTDESNKKVAESSYDNATFLLSYHPSKELKLSFKASYEDFDWNGPDLIRYNGIDYIVPPVISYTRKVADIKAKYALLNNTYIDAEVKRKEVERSSTLLTVPDSSSQNLLRLEVNTSFNENLKVRISEKIEKNNRPPYKNIPENSSKTEAMFDYSFSDNAGIDLLIYYLYEYNDNNDSYFVENITKGGNLTIYYLPEEDLSLNLHMFLETEDYKSDLELGKTGTLEHLVIRTPYEAKNLLLGLNVIKKLNNMQNVYTDIFYMRGYGTYKPDDVSNVLGLYSYSTEGLNKLASVDFYQYGMLLGAERKLSQKDRVKVELSYKEHKDKADDVLSGKIKTAFLSWTRQW